VPWEQNLHFLKFSFDRFAGGESKSLRSSGSQFSNSWVWHPPSLTKRLSSGSGIDVFSETYVLHLGIGLHTWHSFSPYASHIPGLAWHPFSTKNIILYPRYWMIMHKHIGWNNLFMQWGEVELWSNGVTHKLVCPWFVRTYVSAVTYCDRSQSYSL
jgi:hypothetical protein